MKLLSSIIILVILAIPSAIMGYPVTKAENCVNYRGNLKKIEGIINDVIMGEKPFLFLTLESGYEWIMIPDNEEALNFFRANKGKKAQLTCQEGNILFSNDFSGNPPGDCVDALFLISGSLLK